MENSNNPITNDISSIILNTDSPSSSRTSSIASGFLNISMRLDGNFK